MSKTGDLLIIECPDCAAKVSAKVIALKDDFPDEVGAPTQLYFLECSSCNRVLLGYSEMVRTGPEDWDFDRPVRLWPSPKKRTSWKLPLSVRDSIDEATKCIDAKAYSACAVMCGKALESVCKEHGIKDWQLHKGLVELKEKEIIDGRLFEWGETLRKSRNLGAHASGVSISSDDAKDILDFTIAICDYVYVLTDKYEEFKKRQQAK